MGKDARSGIIAAIIGAVAGLAAAFFGAYFTYWLQFAQAGHIQATVASPSIRAVKLRGLQPVGFVMSVTWSNTGARPLCVWDTSLRVTGSEKSTTGPQKSTKESVWFYFAGGIVNYQQEATATPFALPTIESAYTPYVVPGHTAVTRTLWFLPAEETMGRASISTKPWLTIDKLSLARPYTLTVSDNVVNEDCSVRNEPASYRQEAPIQVQLTQTNIDSLAKGEAVVLADQIRNHIREVAMAGASP